MDRKKLFENIFSVNKLNSLMQLQHGKWQRKQPQFVLANNLA
jgi:hypothetical protein